MFKTIGNRAWAFDAEWVPDPAAGRVLYQLADDTPDEQVLQVMWQKGGATAEDPTPYLKTVMCRIVSVAAVDRQVLPEGKISLHLLSLPRDVQDPEQTAESHVVGTFLDKVGQYRPQLVGFNSASADLKAMIQRAVVLGLSAPGFCKRPDKPWEGADYFDSRNSEASIDLKEVIGGWGKATPSLHEIATLSGIPGKMEVEGEQVAGLWLAGNLAKIVAYNECDALTTYLVWLRVAHFAGHFSDEQYEQEQRQVRDLLEQEASENSKGYLKKYLAEWQKLSRILKQDR